MILFILAVIFSPHAAAQTPSPPPPCLDFTSQADAQAFYESQGGPASDPHGLDPNRDGRACGDETPTTPTSPSVSSTATSPVTTTGASTNTATSAGDDLPPGSERGPWGWIGLALAGGGLGLTGFSIWRKRRQAAVTPAAADAPRFDDLGW